MDKKLLLNTITIIFNCILFIISYLLIKEINIHTIHLFISIYFSLTREITRFCGIYLLNRPLSTNSIHNIYYCYYFFIFLKIVNVLNIFLIISNEKQYIFVDNRLLIIYNLYDIISIFIIPKINIQSINNNLISETTINKKRKLIKINLNESNYQSIDDCYICCDRKGNFTILDCNHDMICGICINKIEKCPICRANITEILESIKE
jgi:hypothetical protein